MCLRAITTGSILAFAIAGVRADCYARNGILAMDTQAYTGSPLISCGRGTNNCCFPHEKCGSNLLCANGRDLSRQYCANKEWEGCSNLSPESTTSGLAVRDCKNNIVCYYGLPADCCTNGPLYYVNPLTGEVKNASLADSSATISPSWWQVASTSTLASSTIVSSSATSSGTATLTTSTNSITSVATSSPNPSPKLSAGAGAGIGVAGAVVVVAVAILGWFLVKRRRRRRALQAQSEPHETNPANQYQETGKPPMHDMLQHGHPQPQPQPYPHPPLQPSELDGERPRQELS